MLVPNGAPMARRHSPLPCGLRIDRRNDALAALPDEHPAKRVLILRAECQRDCASREIPWQGREHEAVDQTWTSNIRGRQMSFSGFIYQYVCFDLILHEWLTHPTDLTTGERAVLEQVPQLHGLLEECHAAAVADNNTRILDLLPKAQAFVAEWEACVRRRIKEDNLPLP